MLSIKELRGQRGAVLFMPGEQPLSCRSGLARDAFNVADRLAQNEGLEKA